MKVTPVAVACGWGKRSAGQCGYGFGRASAQTSRSVPTYNEARHRGSENFIVDVVGYGEDAPGSQNLTALFSDRSPDVAVLMSLMSVSGLDIGGKRGESAAFNRDSRARTGRGDARERGAHAPTGRFSSASSLDDRDALRDLPVATQSFELCCADVHPQGCAETLHARDCSDLVEIAREQGARVHGFTPAWYSQQRLADMAAVVTRSDG